MFTNMLIYAHAFPLGKRKFFGEVAEVTSGQVTFKSSRIAKRLARNLSEDFGKCELCWRNDTSSGKVIYLAGQKMHETFNSKG